MSNVIDKIGCAQIETCTVDVNLKRCVRRCGWPGMGLHVEDVLSKAEAAVMAIVNSKL